MKQYKNNKIQLQDLETNLNEYTVYNVVKYGINDSQSVIAFKDIYGQHFSIGRGSSSIVDYAIPDFSQSQYQPIMLTFDNNSTHITIVSKATTHRLCKYGTENKLFSHSERNYFYNDMLNIIKGLNDVESDDIMDILIDNYMLLNYPIVITKVDEDNEEYYKVKVPDLPGLTIYVDKKDDIDDELTDAKREWFASRLKHNQEIPYPTKFTDD